MCIAGKPAPTSSWVQRQPGQTLDSALQDLPEIYRVPVLLRDVHGLSTEEASDRLGIKEQTLKSRLHRGRLFLRTRLAAFADGLSLHRRALDSALATS